MKKQDLKDIEVWHRTEGKGKPDESIHGKRGAREGNLQTMIHGIWANQCLSEEERSLFDEITQCLWNDFKFNHSNDYMQVEVVAINYIKYIRAHAHGDMDAAEKIDRTLRANLKDLKATKITRSKDEPEQRQMTPAEWATSFIEKMRQQQEAEKEAEKKSAGKEKREKSSK